MSLSDAEMETLRTIAQDGNMDYDRWPNLLTDLTTRLNEIARTEFPITKPETPSAESQPADPSQPASLNHEQSSESADKENAPPASEASNHVRESDDPLPREILVRLNSVIKTLTTYFKTYPPHTVQRLSELILEPRRHYKNLPAYLHALDRVVNVTSGANTYPLPAAFPAVLTNGNGAAANSNNVAWGNSTSTQSTLGSDESLGGALLTPIPWLLNGSNSNSESVGSNSRGASVGPIEREVRTESTQTIEGPNGAGSIETVTVSIFNTGHPNSMPKLQNTHQTATQENGSPPMTISSLRAEGGVTQGELIRQEQQLNIVPAAQISARLSDAEGEDDEPPHARGPDEVGVEDMGPQSPRSDGPVLESLSINVEAAVGRRADLDTEDTKMEEDEEEKEEAAVPRTPKREAEEELPERSAKRAKSEDRTDDEQKGDVKKEEDVDVMLVDVDGKAEGETKVGEGEESLIGADAVDTTAA